VEQVVKGIPKVVVYIDDLIIHAATDLLTKVACHRSTAMHTLEALIQKAHGPAQQAALRARTRKMSMATLKGASRVPAPKEAAA